MDRNQPNHLPGSRPELHAIAASASRVTLEVELGAWTSRFQTQGSGTPGPLGNTALTVGANQNIDDPFGGPSIPMLGHAIAGGFLSICARMAAWILAFPVPAMTLVPRSTVTGLSVFFSYRDARNPQAGCFFLNAA